MGETEDEVCRSRGAPLQVVGRKNTHTTKNVGLLGTRGEEELDLRNRRRVRGRKFELVSTPPKDDEGVTSERSAGHESSAVRRGKCLLVK